MPKAQHERITIASDRKISVRLKADLPPIDFEADDTGCVTLYLNSEVKDTDHEGRKALILVMECVNANGSFAALRTDNATPFVGKRVRVKGWGDGTYEVCAMYATSVRFVEGGVLLMDMSKCLPLDPPAKKYRPLTPKEAVEHLGRGIVYNGKHLKLLSVGIERACVTTDGSWDNYGTLCSEYTWADTGLPVGVEVVE